jgi:hypothetical protein
MAKNENNPNGILRYAGLATQWMVTLLLAVWLGYEADYKWIGWRLPVTIIILPLLALVMLFWQLIKSFNKPKNEK